MVLRPGELNFDKKLYFRIEYAHILLVIQTNLLFGLFPEAEFKFVMILTTAFTLTFLFIS